MTTWGEIAGLQLQRASVESNNPSCQYGGWWNAWVEEVLANMVESICEYIKITRLRKMEYMDLAVGTYEWYWHEVGEWSRKVVGVIVTDDQATVKLQRQGVKRWEVPEASKHVTLEDGGVYTILVIAFQQRISGVSEPFGPVELLKDTRKVAICFLSMTKQDRK